MATQKGKYVWWGNSFVATGAAVGAITAEHTGVTFEHNSDIKEIKGASNDTVTVVFSDEKYDLTIDMIPTSVTSAALAKGQFKLPAFGEVVTITGENDDGSPSIGNTAGVKYLYIGGTKKPGTEEGMMTWRLRRFVPNAASITGA